jgi:hypothetical protein
MTIRLSEYATVEEKKAYNTIYAFYKKCCKHNGNAPEPKHEFNMLFIFNFEESEQSNDIRCFNFIQFPSYETVSETVLSAFAVLGIKFETHDDICRYDLEDEDEDEHEHEHVLYKCYAEFYFSK